jgi:hypothetical protein
LPCGDDQPLLQHLAVPPRVEPIADPAGDEGVDPLARQLGDQIPLDRHRFL